MNGVDVLRSRVRDIVGAEDTPDDVPHSIRQVKTGGPELLVVGGAIIGAIAIAMVKK